MYSSIKKRNDVVVKFNAQKIEVALAKAGEATGEYDKKVAKELATKVIARAEKTIKNEVPSVDEIQDIAEDILLASKYKKTAKAYIIYRDQHDKMRRISIDSHIDLIDSYLGDLDWLIKENSNMGYSLQGLNNYVSSAVTKDYWLDKVYAREIGDAHPDPHLFVGEVLLVLEDCFDGHLA